VRRLPAVPLLLTALVLLPALAALGSRTFFVPDETWYAEAAAGMLGGGDLVVPRVTEQPWWEKPPGYLWLLAAAFAVLGVGLPAAVVANVLLTVGVAWLIARYLGRESPRAGILAAVAFVTMFLPMAVARTALTDAALTLCTTGAIVGLLGGGAAGAVLGGAALGFGMLVKGPVAPLVVVPALVAGIILGRRPGDARRAWWFAAAAGAVVIPWPLLVAGRGLLGALVAELLGRQLMSRVVDPWSIRAPFWYYLPVLWVALFPWGSRALLGGRTLLASDRARRAAEVAAVVVPLLAFSIARNKLPHYLLPLLPWIAVGLGRALDRRWSQRSSDVRLLPVLLLEPAALVAAAIWLPTVPAYPLLPGWTGSALVALAVVTAGLAVAEAAGKARVAWGGLVLVALALFGAVDRGVLPHLERQRINRAVGAAMTRSLPGAGVPVAFSCSPMAFDPAHAGAWRSAASLDALSVAVGEIQERGGVPVVVCRTAHEGDVRSLAWRHGGEAREAFRLSGIGEEYFTLVEMVGLEVSSHRDGRHFFTDFDEVLPGERGFGDLEGNRWLASFRWTVAARCGFPVMVRTARSSVVRLRAWGLADAGQAQQLTVLFDGSTVGTATLGPRASIPVFGPLAPSAADTHTVTLAVRHLVRPVDIQPGSTDPRTLGAALDWLVVEPEPAPVNLLAAPLATHSSP
jgi:4-amino-4-deoxy-L-arabinose transferase-like glycosyltransferase